MTFKIKFSDILISFFFVCLFFGFPANALATTYCVRADGSSTKANATGPSTDATKCMSLATHNSTTFSAGDIIQLSSQGGNYVFPFLVPPSSGSAGSPITYEEYAGETPILASTTGSNLISIVGKSYITVDGLTVASSSTNAVRVSGSGVSNITLRNLNLDSSGYVMNIFPTGGSSNILLEDITLNSRATTGANEGVYIYFSTSTDLVLRRINSTGGAVFIDKANNITLEDIIASSTINDAIKITNSAGTLSILRATTSPAANKYGANISFSSLAGTINNLNITGGSNGLYLATTTGPLTFSNFNINNAVTNGIKTIGPLLGGMIFSNGSIDSGTYGFNGQATGGGFTLQDISITSKGTNKGIYFYGSTTDNIVLRRVTSAGGGISIEKSHNPVLEDIIITDAKTDAIEITNATGTISILRATSTPLSGIRGLSLNASVLSGRVDGLRVTGGSDGLRTASVVGPITFQDFILIGGSTAGVRVSGTSSALSFVEGSVSNYADDAYQIVGGTTNVSFERCLADSNGGDGFTSHDGDNSNVFRYCVAKNNGLTGFAMVETSAGNISNVTTYNNGTVGGIRAGWYFPLTGNNPTTGSSWQLRNIINSANNPASILYYSNGLTGVPIFNSDFNLFDINNDSGFAVNKYPSPSYASTATTSWSTYVARAVGEANSIHSDPLLNSSLTLKDFSPAIDAGDPSVVTSTTTDYSGNPLYGTPDIGAYEYQPPYTITTTNPEYTGNIRIYNDGRYRYTTATSSLVIADFLVTPSGGAYATYDASTTRPEYLNIIFNTWELTGDKNKSWTASSSIASDTIYTIGDLLPNTQYSIKIDGINSVALTSAACSNSVCLSDSTGHLTFTYTGAYSTHIFELTKVLADDVTPPASSGGGTTLLTQIDNLLMMGNTKLADELKNKYQIKTAKVLSPIILNLSYRMNNKEVKLLQQFLNTQGFPVAKSGVGSKGYETTYFGLATKKAVMRFQAANKIRPVSGFVGPLTRQVISRILK